MFLSELARNTKETWKLGECTKQYFLGDLCSQRVSKITFVSLDDMFQAYKRCRH